MLASFKPVLQYDRTHGVDAENGRQVRTSSSPQPPTRLAATRLTVGLSALRLRLHENFVGLPEGSAELKLQVLCSSVNPSDLSTDDVQKPKPLGSDVVGVVLVRRF